LGNEDLVLELSDEASLSEDEGLVAEVGGDRDLFVEFLGESSVLELGLDHQQC
jgi:hypothetical protein